MRTTVTLDGDTEALIKALMRDRGLTFKEAINAAIRAGLAVNGGDATFQTPTFAMGFDPAVPWDKALRLATEVEDQETIRKLAARK